MFKLIFTIVAILLMVGITAFLFYRLKSINKYNIAIYIFLLSFWVAMAMMKKNAGLDNVKSSVPIWAWALAFGSYQFTQVIFRVPFGIISARMRSRNMPILFSTLAITISIIVIIATNFSIASIIVAMVVTGIYGSTFGMQYQYWSENFDIRSVYLSVAIMGLIPSFASTVGDFSSTLLNNPSPTESRYFMIALATFVFAASVLYYLFPERKETIRLDNIYAKEHRKVSQMNIRHVVELSAQTILLSFAFNMLTSQTSYQDVISANSDEMTIIQTFVAFVVALVTAIYLARYFDVKKLLLGSQIIIMIGLLTGIIIYFKNSASDLAHGFYLAILIIGFTMFQTVIFGSVLHLDHKNKMLALGIWLSIRSFANGSGQFTGEMVSNTYGSHTYKYVLIVSLVLSILSLFWFFYLIRKKSDMHYLFNVTDHYEHKQKALKIFKPRSRIIKRETINREKAM